MRAACDKCGAWVDDCGDTTSWPARRDEFATLHRHIPGSPLVNKAVILDADRDAFTAAVVAKGYVLHQATPLGGSWAVFVSKPAAPTVKDDRVVRVFATSAAALGATLP